MQKEFDNSSLSEKIIAEKNQAYKEIETDLIHLSEIQQDLNAMVHKQGEELEVAERNIESSRGFSQEGVQNLIEAEKYQETLRRRKFWLGVGIVGATVTVLGNWIYSSIKSNEEEEIKK